MRKLRHSLQFGRPARGFGLIEVLITLFVVAVGLLSIAGLQAFSKKTNFDALQRATAAALAQDIAERMRANQTVTGNYLTTGVSETSPLPAPAKDCAASGVTCSNAELATDDLYKWSQALFGSSEKAGDGSNAGGLSTATGCIVQAADACQFTVTIAWRGVTPLGQDDTSVACGLSNSQSGGLYQNAKGEPLRRYVTVTVFVDPKNGTIC